MQVEVFQAPIEYELTYMPKRGRNQRTQLVVDVAPVGVSACSDDEAPLAFRVTMSAIITHYHAWNGKLYQRVLPHLSVEDLSTIEAKESPFVERYARIRTGDDKRIPKPTDFTTLSIKHIVATDRAAGLARAQARADQLLLIGGCLFEQTPGPVYCVTVESGRKRTNVRLVDPLSPEPSLNPGLFFRLDQRDVAVAIAEKLSKHPPSVDGEQLHLDFNRVKADLDRFGIDLEAYGTVALAQRFFEGMDEFRLTHLPTDYLKTWVRYHSPGFDRRTASPELEEMVRSVADIFKDNREARKYLDQAKDYSVRMDAIRELTQALPNDLRI